MKIIKNAVCYPIEVTNEDRVALEGAIKVINSLYEDIWDTELNTIRATNGLIARRDDLIETLTVLTILAHAESIS